ncbi:MAG: NADH-quinone oxidoreductase subunit N [Actinomycetota bacterium]|nr:NADH-quinone oxidoreductase subunit N [Actinomycetota bacterium]MDK1026709.1 NADH-quinone oxidoreductase subunit N [Actinomycetota bacterium]MDK1038328.1 NADH-quinone oxidoreductase subunit N [Actinomycetota bacterium]MDK1102980.1 NADH-quinone oxidoreductase subunit N [Actinomycetota bacterium]MDK1291939.1 NADH-quinone oxidoreductase subunit N [Actinomycetota bacterium]
MGNAALLPVAFEVILIAGALLVLMVAVIADRRRSVWAPIAGVAYLAAAAAGILQWRAVAESGGDLYFSTPDIVIVRSPMVVMDGFSAFAAILLGLLGFVALLGSWDLVVRLGKRSAEFVALGLLAVAGLHMMAATPNLIVIFIGLETASISFYILAGFIRGSRASDESALKYFLLGSLASAMFLYGIALTFAATGSLTIYGANSIRDFFSVAIITEPGILLAGLALMLAGLFFKVSAAPFHQWAPDVYQGAPSAAVGLMAAGIKVAAFAALARIFIGGFISQIDAWAPIIGVVAALSMVVGTTMALVQTDLKRLLAYSGVAHSGYLLATFVGGVEGVPPMWFYVSTYAFMVVGAFTIVSVVNGPAAHAAPISSFKGLAKRSPEMGWLLAIIMFGLSGMPFFAGFVGKVFAFVVAGEAGFLWLVVIGTLATVVGLAFYLKVVATIFAPDESGEGLEASTSARIAIAISATVTVVFGIVPWPLLEVVRDALPI